MTRPVRDPAEALAFQDHQVGATADGQRTVSILDAQHPRRVRRGRDERFQRRHAVEGTGHRDGLRHREHGRGPGVAVRGQRHDRTAVQEPPHVGRVGAEQERRGGQHDGGGRGRAAEGRDPVGGDVVQVVGAPRAEPHGRLGGTRGAELIRVAPDRQAVRSGGLGDGREVLERERDVLDVDVDGVGEVLGGRDRDQLLAHGADPRGSIDPVGHRVAGEEGHRAGLRGLLGQAPREARLAQLGLERQPVARLQLERGRSVVGHLLQQRPAERQDLLVRGCGEHPGAARDPALAVELAVADAGQARLELVVAPPDEGEVGVAVHEPRHDRAVLEALRRDAVRQVADGADVRDDPVLPRHGAVGDPEHLVLELASDRPRSGRGQQQRGRDGAAGGSGHAAIERAAGGCAQARSYTGPP